MSQVKLSDAEYRTAVEGAFKHFDKNGDGLLDQQEFNAMYAAISGQLNFPLTDQILKFLFEQMSGKSNQPLTSEQLYRGLQAFYSK